jgi:hypothetical protein
MGRPPIGERPMTGAERVRRHRLGLSSKKVLDAVTITLTLTEAEATWLARVVDRHSDRVVTDWVAGQETIVWPDRRPGVESTHSAYVRTPVLDEEAAAEIVQSAQAKVLRALEAAGVEISDSMDAE